MRNLCLWFLLALVCATGKAQFDDEFGDFWNNDYDSVYDSDTFAEPIQEHSKEILHDKAVQDEIDMFREVNDAAEEKDLDDYQFEDNRSKDKEELTDEKTKVSSENDDIESLEEFDALPENDDVEEHNDENSEKVDENLRDVDVIPVEEDDTSEINNDYALLWGDPQEDEALNKIKEDEERVLDETKAILEEEVIENSDFDEKNIEEESNVDENVIQETKNILGETDNDFDNLDEAKEELSDEFENNAEDKQVQSQEAQQDDVDVLEASFDDSAETVDNIKKEIGDQDDSLIAENAKSEELSVDQAYADLNADLDQLFETLDKLSNDNDETEKVSEEEVVNKETKEDDFDEQKFHDALNMDPLDYEEKYGVPYREGLTLLARNDALDYEGIDSEEIVNEEEEANFEDLFKDTETTTQKEQILYANDAFDDNELNKDAEDIDAESSEKASEDNDSEKTEDVITTKVDVDELTSAEVSELMGQFTDLHKDELDSESEDFDKHIAPVFVTISVDDPTVVSSPNYPDPYTTNNVIDWVFQGEGMGIELNITDFAVNGALGDYLLVKPGGIDASGKDGLVFSYRLNSPRRYRFMNVDRLFVRFDAKQGMAFFRGFQFSVKMISPLPEEAEPVPEPEPVLTPPSETMTLNLGGITLLQFQKIEEEFRVLIADMATEYISSNNINQGLNTTFEITQITRSAICNIHWPESETCVKVTVGVPLSYEEEEEPRLTTDDLETLWRTYIRRDPFALRLQRLGITEFAMPDDRSVLIVWLVIAAGVLISMSLLAFALWRFSCFEDYTRMKASSDTDSVNNEKRTLDLYPTPHQTLPPLYADTEYKWVDDDSTRVDMGGFANKSYTRELYEYDSDDDVIPRDRKSTSGKNFFDA